MLVGLVRSPPYRACTLFADTYTSHRYKAVWYIGLGVDVHSNLEALGNHRLVSRFLL